MQAACGGGLGTRGTSDGAYVVGIYQGVAILFISFKDLIQEQKRDLDYKIETAVQAIQSGFDVCRHRPALAFSGGKDSTVLWHLIRTHFPEQKVAVIFGNTGVEFPESLTFARRLGREWGGCNFYETSLGRTKQDGYKYKAQQEILQWLIGTGAVGKVLKADGKLKTTRALERACPDHLKVKFEKEGLIWPAGTRKSFLWSVDQYGWPLLGKAASKLKARRINIECFLRFSKSQSDDTKLLEYYDLLKKVKFSQACCDILKKEPSERIQAELDVDVVFKGLMAAESRARKINFVSRGYLFRSNRKRLGDDPFYHCNPLSIWTDDDIWAYTKRFNVPHSALYDMGWTDVDGVHYKVKRNGCMACGTDLLYRNNHMSILRRTHPKQWDFYMRRGMAEEIRKIQLIKSKNGNYSMFDMYDARELMEVKPCIFDRIN